jgi:hypothetical protein
LQKCADPEKRRSRKTLKNEALIAKIDVDIAEKSLGKGKKHVCF